MVRVTMGDHDLAVVVSFDEQGNPDECAVFGPETPNPKASMLGMILAEIIGFEGYEDVWRRAGEAIKRHYTVSGGAVN